VSKQQRKQANKKLKEVSVELTKLESVLSEVLFWSNIFFLVGCQNSPSLFPSSQFVSRFPNLFLQRRGDVVSRSATSKRGIVTRVIALPLRPTPVQFWHVGVQRGKRGTACSLMRNSCCRLHWFVPHRPCLPNPKRDNSSSPPPPPSLQNPRAIGSATRCQT
jgi:hypothetical protein